MTTCSIPRCRAEADLDYLGRGICERHWNELAAEDAPPDALRMVLGIEANAPTAMEEPMSETTTAAESAAEEGTMTPKKKATTKARTPKKRSPKRVAKKPATAKKKEPAGPKPNRVFAIRVTDDELAALHKAAGPRNASRFIRAVAAAFAAEDEGAFRAVLKEARELR